MILRVYRRNAAAKRDQKEAMQRTTLAVAILLCAVVAAGCGRECSTWKDVSGRDRDEGAMMADARQCNRQSGFDKRYRPEDLKKRPELSIEFQEAARKRDLCMSGKGWELTTEVCKEGEI